mmetsp:Transcript_33354/g.84965  ORF Transcript_33354/g.84965 Transcript_33354/m.84965 type:complete len:223 (+) Transcript_33354:569-1237(+)
MQRDGQLDFRQIVHEAPHVVHDADGAHGDTARRDTEALHIHQASDGVHDALVVFQRLTHAHEDDVGHRPQSPRMHKLLLDLAGPKVALEPHGAGGAEGAAEPAAHLRRDAEGVALAAAIRLPCRRILRFARVVYQHTLDLTSVLQTNQQLDRAVDLRLESGCHGRSQKSKLFLQRQAYPVRDPRYLVQRAVRIRKHVPPNLAHVDGLDAMADQKRAQRGLVQ